MNGTKTRFLCGSFLLAFTSPAFAAPAKPKPVRVTMNQISVDGVGAAVGTVKIRQTKEGVELAVNLKELSPGEHGFHLHEKGSCYPADKDGKKTSGQAAGPHWDPDATKAHKGPGGGGHKGDLPKLIVTDKGKFKGKLPVAGLVLADLQGKSLMIHAGGDTYSDTPSPLGGGGDRIVCGVIPAGPATPAAAVVPSAAAVPAAAAAPAAHPGHPAHAAPAAPAAAGVPAQSGKKP
ncbi:MAG: superoxide dismutase family protein [Deltaproteobacteria bacterium]|nr:superoxide dismutase family protein [Deltaproteobacteria bacterium]